MIIRQAKPQDADAIIELGNSSADFRVSEGTVNFWPKNILEDCIKSPDNPVLVAEQGEEIAGFVIVNYNPHFKKATIENIFVNQKFRGQGTGKLLIQALLKELKALKCLYACCLIKQNCPAADFYIKNGFKRGIDCVWLDMVLGDSFGE